MNNQSEKIKMSIGPNDLELQKCECGNHIFFQGFTLNKITKIIGNTNIMPMPIFVCEQCKKEFDPEKENLEDKAEERKRRLNEKYMNKLKLS